MEDGFNTKAEHMRNHSGELLRICDLSVGCLLFPYMHRDTLRRTNALGDKDFTYTIGFDGAIDIQDLANPTDGKVAIPGNGMPLGFGSLHIARTALEKSLVANLYRKITGN